MHNFDPYDVLCNLTELCVKLETRITQQEAQIAALNTCVDVMARQLLADHNYQSKPRKIK